MNILIEIKKDTIFNLLFIYYYFFFFIDWFWRERSNQRQVNGLGKVCVSNQMQIRIDYSIVWSLIDAKKVAYPKVNTAFSVSPVTAAAIARIKVVKPNEAWIGTNAALKPAVAPSQHSKIKKLKNPTTNWNDYID